MCWEGIRVHIQVEWRNWSWKDELILGDDFSDVTTDWLWEVGTSRGRIDALGTEGVVCEISVSGKARLFENHIAVLAHCWDYIWSLRS